MTAGLRGAWTERRPLLVLAASCLVLVAATTVATPVATAAGSSYRMVSVLLLIGATAVVAPATELTRLRRTEVGLARLRGAHSVRLLALLLTRPLVAVLVGSLAGFGCGAALVSLLGDRLADGLVLEVARAGLVAAGSAALLALVVLVTVVVGARAHVADQLAPRPRRRDAPAWQQLLEVVLVVVAALACVRAAGAGSDPDLLVMCTPALVGLATAQVLARLARAATPGPARSGGRSLAAYLAVRRFTRSAVGASLRVPLAASVLAVVALSGAVAVDGWTDAGARVRTGAPISVGLPDLNPLQALLLTRQVDPEGRYLAAGAVDDEDDRAAERRVWLDTGRYAGIVGDFLDPTAAADLVGRLDAVGVGEEVVAARGDTIVLRGRLEPPDVTQAQPPRVTISYLSDLGYTEAVDLELDLDGTEVTASARLPHCTTGCVVTEVTSFRGAGVDRGRPAPALRVSELGFGDQDLLASQWQESGAGADAPPVQGRGGLVLAAGRTIEPVAASAPLAVVTAGDPDWPQAGPAMVDFDGSPRRVDVDDDIEALPLVEGGGVLADLPVALAAAAPTGVAFRSVVLAAHGTPDDVLSALAAAGGDPAVRAGSLDPTAAEQRVRDRVRLLEVLAAGGLLIGCLSLATPLGRLRRDRARETAALRLAGVPSREVRRANRIQTILVALLAGVGVVAGGALATAVSLDALLGAETSVNELPLVAALDPGALAGLALGTALVVAWAAYRGQAGGEGRRRPAALIGTVER